ncbi:DUF29 domain-containing protein [Synechococcus sp. PCC 6312]|uniref:DUF29 domain-containing protein n=1 Tax=Synechococcus sp. (strain ATCC 27167 / PCC 6312) TaxID=195253 RepID=UPI00029F3262|nr:DUF29 domain-containing protein [Synechococcus sp. PCC 6312]AFY62538.1 protein of unknown function DUF29 [Synechococcus sp. PCC 6312]
MSRFGEIAISLCWNDDVPPHHQAKYRQIMKKIYEQDFALWSEKMADLITSRHFDELDIENLVEEVRDLSKRERDRLLSSVRLILHHLLKLDY